MSPLFGIRLLAVGPHPLEVLRLVRAMSSRDLIPPAAVKAELENGLPMLISDNLDYHDVRLAIGAFEKLGASVEVFTSLSD